MRHITAHEDISKSTGMCVHIWEYMHVLLSRAHSGDPRTTASVSPSITWSKTLPVHTGRARLAGINIAVDSAVSMFSVSLRALWLLSRTIASAPTQVLLIQTLLLNLVYKSLPPWTLSRSPRRIIFQSSFSAVIHLLYLNHFNTIRSMKAWILQILTKYIPVSNLGGVHLVECSFLSLSLLVPWSTPGFPSSGRAGLRWSQSNAPARARTAPSRQPSSWHR